MKKPAWSQKRLCGWNQIAALGLVVCLCGVIGFVTFLHLSNQILPEDDAFITYRYVSNLIAGKGLVYNVGEPVMGSSTALYVFWLALMRLLIPLDLAELSVRLNLIWYLVTALLIYLIVRELTGRKWLGALAVMLVMLELEMLQWSLAGMESFLFVALMLGTALLLERKKYLAAAVLADLSMVARPEGIFVVGVCALTWFRFERKNVLRFLVCLIGIGSLYYAFAWYTFGTPVPQSVVAKSRGVFELPFADTFKGMALRLSYWLTRDIFPSRILDLAVALVLVVGGAVGLAHVKSARGLILNLLVLLLCFVFIYGVTNAPLFGWYLPWLWAPFFVLEFIGLWGLANWASTSPNRLMAWIQKNTPASGRSPLGYRGIALGMMIFYFVLLALGPYVHALQNPNFNLLAIRARDLTLRVNAYGDAARWLDTIAPASATAAASEIGAFGYYWHGNVIDPAGLVSPVAVRYFPQAHAERNTLQAGFSTALLQATTPDFVITHPALADGKVLSDPWFHREYQLVRAFPLTPPLWNSTELLVFQKSK